MYTRVFGRKTYNLGKENGYTKREVHTLANGSVARDTTRVLIHGLTELSIQEVGPMVNAQAMAQWNGQMVRSTKVFG